MLHIAPERLNLRLRAQLRKLAAQQTRTRTLDPADRPVDAELRVHFKKQMNVVGHDLHFHDLAVHFSGFFLYNDLQALVYSISQEPAGDISVSKQHGIYRNIPHS